MQCDDKVSVFKQFYIKHTDPYRGFLIHNWQVSQTDSLHTAKEIYKGHYPNLQSVERSPQHSRPVHGDFDSKDSMTQNWHQHQWTNIAAWEARVWALSFTVAKVYKSYKINVLLK